MSRFKEVHIARITRAAPHLSAAEVKTRLLIFQPPYSPEVNPVEHLWEELREKYLHNRVFSSLEELVEVLCQALSELTDEKERLRSMMFFPHFRVES